MRKFLFAAAVAALIPSSSPVHAQAQPCPMVFESAQTLFVDSFVDRMICLQQGLSASTVEIGAEAAAAPLFEAPAGGNQPPAGETPAS